MRLKNIILILTMLLLNFPLVAQNKTKKELRIEKSLVKEKEVKDLLDKGEFEFVAKRVLPQGYRNIELDYDTYKVIITADKISGDLPYFGRAYSITYGGSGGIKFEGKPEVFERTFKKNIHRYQIEVKGQDDYYKLILTITSGGSANVAVISNNRAPINYDGIVQAIPEKKI